MKPTMALYERIADLLKSDSQSLANADGELSIGTISEPFEPSLDLVFGDLERGEAVGVNSLVVRTDEQAFQLDPLTGDFGVRLLVNNSDYTFLADIATMPVTLYGIMIANASGELFGTEKFDEPQTFTDDRQAIIIKQPVFNLPYSMFK